MKIAVCWYLKGSYRRFGLICCFHKFW